MLLVILGAGASYDSVNVETAYEDGIPPNRQWRPPLAQNLFQARENFGAILARYRQALPLAVGLRQRLSRDRGFLLERALNEVQQRSLEDPKASQQLMAVRLYLRDILAGCGTHWSQDAFGATNYDWLVDRLDRWARQNRQTVIYVTFNYDTMLDEALTGETGQSLADTSAYVSHPRFKLIKVHGSVDWAYRLTIAPGSDAFKWVIDNAHDLARQDLGTIEVRTNWQTGLNGEAWVPALAVPLETKDDFVCPPNHIQVLAESLPQIDRVLVIGWRATEQRFLELMGANLPRTLVGCLVACADQNASRSTWSNIARAASGVIIRTTGGPAEIESGLGFSSLIESDQVEQLLA